MYTYPSLDYIKHAGISAHEKLKVINRLASGTQNVCYAWNYDHRDKIRYGMLEYRVKDGALVLYTSRGGVTYVCFDGSIPDEPPGSRWWFPDEVHV